MSNFTLRKYESNDLPALGAFIKGYLETYPDAKLHSAEYYTHHPLLKSGENVFYVADTAQQMVGFVPMFPITTTDENGVTAPHTIWTIILADPRQTTADVIRDSLYDAILEKVEKLKSEYGLSWLRLAADLMVSQTGDITYLKQKGFEVSEQIDVMQRDPFQPIPQVEIPEHIIIQTSRLEMEAEQAAYLDVYNTCFAQNPHSIEDLQYLFKSPTWEIGRAITAISSSGQLIGSILVYWDEQQNHGITDDVMVLPDWRGKNIAKRLVAEGLQYFQSIGLHDARLEVRESNTPAVAAYCSVGYHTINQEWILYKTV